MFRSFAALLFLAGLVALAGCTDDAPPSDVATAEADAFAAPAAGSDDRAAFFRVTIDGVGVPIASDDVLVTSQPDGSLRIFAGPDGGTSVILTIPAIASCPCNVPAGSTSPGDVLDQGAVSLQNHPERGNGLNSWYVGQPGTPPADAIAITDIGVLRDGARFISGTIDATVLRTDSNGDSPGNRDTRITGEFRVRHEPRGGEF